MICFIWKNVLEIKETSICPLNWFEILLSSLMNELEIKLFFLGLQEPLYISYIHTLIHISIAFLCIEKSVLNLALEDL